MNPSSYEEAVASLLSQRALSLKGRINAMMQPRYVSSDPAAHSLTLAYPVLDWELNPFEILHGGIIAAAMDSTMGILSYILSGCLAPTVNLNLSFLRPLQPGDELLVTARALHVGRSLIQLTAEASSAKDGCLCSSASAVFHLPRRQAQD
jgi:uncharacterized protein (TIGR00369 family)